jgi:pilus assembly protein Flp/PilA
MNKLKKFFFNEEGATAVEYGIMIGAIAAIIIGVAFSIGDGIQPGFNAVDDQISNISASE